MPEVYKGEHVRLQERLSEPSDHGAGLTLSEGDTEGKKEAGVGGRFLRSHAVQGKLGKAKGQSQSPRCPSEESQGWACFKSWPCTASAWEQPMANTVQLR